MEDTLIKWRPLIDDAIADLLPQEVDEEYLADFFGEPSYRYQTEAIQQALANPVWDLLNRGGKRWRAILFLVVVDALGDDPHEFLPYACIPEILHNGTIVVDDIEDTASQRRGKRALHHQHGIDIALNAGNAMYFIPLKIIANNDAELNSERRLETYEMLTDEFNRTYLGQGMDIYWHNQREISVSKDQYYEMCACKTGGLVRIVARLAAIVTGQPEHVEQQLAKYAEEMSISFQITDDLLDVKHTIGQSGSFGKEFGNDIKEGKKTLLTIYTAENAPAEDIARLEELLWDDDNTEEEVIEAIEIMQDAGALEHAEQHARTFAASARDRLQSIELEPEPQRQLESFTKYVINRIE